MPYSVAVEKTIPRPRHEVFAALMDFGAIAKLAPDAIATCRVEGTGVGAIRYFTLKGDPTEMAERLECAHGETVFSYSLITPNPLGLEHYHSVVILADAVGGGCSITWGSNWTSLTTPATEMKAMLSHLYVTLIDAIARS